MSFSTTAVRSVAVPGLLLLLALAAALSLTIGAKSLPIGTVFTAFSGTCQSADCTIVLDARLPRTLAGLLAGVALGLAGALMQTLTRNPLADPGLLGSTPAPASPSSSARRCLGSLPAGAAAAGILRRALRLAAGSLYRQPGGGQLSPVRLTLAGVALAAVLEGCPTASPCSTRTSTISYASGRPVRWISAPCKR